MPLRFIPAAARREITIILFIAMEVAWIAVALDLVQALLGLGDKLPAVWAMILYPATVLYFRTERRWRVRLLWRIVLRTVVVGTALLLTLGAFAWPEISAVSALPAAPVGADLPSRILALEPALPALVGVICLFAILRGWLLGPRQMDNRGFLAGFHLGIGVLFVSVFGQHLAGLEATDMLPGVIVFFGLGLYGLGADRWLRSEVSARAASQAGWPLLGLGLIALILCVGALFWTHVDQETVRLLLTPVFWLWDLLVRMFLFLISLFPKVEPAKLAITPAEMGVMPESVRKDPFDWGETVRTIGKVMFYVATTCIVVGALLRNLVDLLLWMNRRLGQSQGIAYEHSTSGLLSDLRDLLAGIVGFLSRLWRRLASLLRGAGSEAMAPEVRAVRGVYRRLLVWAGQRGWPKPAGRTPNEFLEDLLTSVPQLEADFATITHNYVAVRYGSALPTPEAVRAVRASWRRVRKVKRRKPPQ
jgi:Domain of unknown function (DUF4129)